MFSRRNDEILLFFVSNWEYFAFHKANEILFVTQNHATLATTKESSSKGVKNLPKFWALVRPRRGSRVDRGVPARVVRSVVGSVARGREVSLLFVRSWDVPSWIVVARSSGGAALGVVARGGAYPRAKFRSSSVRVHKRESLSFPFSYPWRS